LTETSAKAVADGAVAWYIQHSVKRRATRYAYGLSNMKLHDPENLLHRSRELSREVDGDFVRHVWSQIIAKVRNFINIYVPFLIVNL
jgi:hypothetical protein